MGSERYWLAGAAREADAKVFLPETACWKMKLKLASADKGCDIVVSGVINVLIMWTINEVPC